MGVETESADLLRCTRCGGELHQAGDGEGAVACGNGHQFPVINGVPRFVDSEAYAGSFGIEWKRFPRVQLDSANGTRITANRFKQLTGLDADALAGKRVLEAGCGPGRFLDVLSRAGAEVHGADLSLAVEVAAENLSHDPNARVVQADLFELPYPEEAFDLVYSFGVLHHTPDPEAAFRAILRHLKPGGRVAVWVYGLGVSSGIRARWIPRPHQVYGPIFRAIPERSREKVLTAYTRFALAAGQIPVAGNLMSILFPIQDLRKKRRNQDGFEEGGDVRIRDELRYEWALHSAFDWFTPTYMRQFEHDEVVGWAERAGLVEIEKRRVQSAIVATKPLTR